MTSTTTMMTRRHSLGSLFVFAASVSLLVFATITGTLGCGSSDKDEAAAATESTRPARAPGAQPTDFDDPPPIGQLPSQVWPREQYYRNALALMDNIERMGYFEQSNDYKRDLYLRQIGADARVDLRVMLEPGMDLGAIRQRFVDEEWSTEPIRYGFSEVYVLKRFNGRGYTRMMLTMLNGELRDWSTYSDQQWQRDEAIYAECARIERSLDRVLERGMSASGLRNFIREWPVENASIYLMLADTRRFVESRETLQSRLRREEFMSRLEAWDVIAQRVYPDAAPDEIDYYERRMRDPDAIRTEVGREYWRFDFPFGSRTIYLFLEWQDAVLVDWFAEPMPDTFEIR